MRLLSGVAVLLPLAWRGRRRRRDAAGPSVAGARLGGSWPAALALALYALPFSYAYLSLAAGTGALLAFGAVQATMIAAGLLQGERPGPLTWAGYAIAIAGLVALIAPGVTAPAPGGAMLMVLAGASWGIYSLLGRAAADPVAATAGNFLRAAPLGLAASLLTMTAAHADRRGVLLAIVSGAITSALGYIAWYAALPALGAMRAATAQLAVPVLAALGGVLLLGEAMTTRLGAAALLILGGIALALRGRTS